MGDLAFATCGQCNTRFAVKPTSGKALFCSRKCWRAFEAARKPSTDCLQCKKPFPFQPHFAKSRSGKGRYCSRKCYLDSRATKPIRPLEDRFWEKVVKSAGDGCWTWSSTKDKKGYGRIMASRDQGPRRQLLASRVSWELHYGPIPPGMGVLHRCDNPACVRPDHFFLGDQIANMADCAAKGRTVRGERAPWAKLTNAQAIGIRQEFAERREPFAVIARRHGVSRSLISDLLKGRRWGWLGGDLTANHLDQAANVGATYEPPPT
jgi:hypothetical protein